MQRRDFLKLCGASGLGVAFPLGLGAQADPAPYDGPYYIVFNASGGWDTTYLMDPKGVNNINRLYQEGDILTRGAHKYAPTARHIQAPRRLPSAIPPTPNTWFPSRGATPIRIWSG